MSLVIGRLTRLFKRQGILVAGFSNGNEDQPGFTNAVASTLDRVDPPAQPQAGLTRHPRGRFGQKAL